jgi:hypothetical protein
MLLRGRVVVVWLCLAIAVAMASVVEGLRHRFSFPDYPVQQVTRYHPSTTAELFPFLAQEYTSSAFEDPTGAGVSAEIVAKFRAALALYPLTRGGKRGGGSGKKGFDAVKERVDSAREAVAEVQSIVGLVGLESGADDFTALDHSYFFMATLYDFLQEPQNALVALREAHKRAPGSLHTKAFVYRLLRPWHQGQAGAWEQSRWDMAREAGEACDAILAEHPGDVETLIFAAISDVVLGNVGEALALFGALHDGGGGGGGGGGVMGDEDLVWTMREFPRWEFYHWYARALRLAGAEGRARALDKEAVRRAVYQGPHRQMPYAGLPFKDHTYQAVWPSLAACLPQGESGDEEGVLEAHWPVPKSVLYRNLVGDVCGAESSALRDQVSSFYGYYNSGPLGALAHTELLDPLHGFVASGGAWRTTLLDVYMQGHKAVPTGLCLPAKAPHGGGVPPDPPGMQWLCDIVRYHRPVLNQYEGGASVLLLAPGTRMAAHCEGAHGALRLMLPVRVQAGAELQVGKELLRLEEGVPVVFDPTVVHYLSNTAPTDAGRDDSVDEDDVDIFVCFDLMHPSNTRWHPRARLWRRIGYLPQHHRSTAERVERQQAWVKRQSAKQGRARDEL